MIKNVGLMLRQRAVASTNLEAFVEPSTSVRASYDDLNRLANRCASTLRGLGLVTGDRIALLMQNSIEFVALFYGAAKLGLVVVPLNTRLTASEQSFILSDSGTKVMFYDASSSQVVEAIQGSDEHSLSIEHYIEKLHRDDSTEDSLAAHLARSSDQEPEILVGDQDNLFIMYTSGTTGLPKGVVHSHESIMWAALSWASTVEVRYKDRLLLPLPMFHVAALTTTLFCAARGVTLVSMPDFDPSSVWSLILEERINIAALDSFDDL